MGTHAAASDGDSNKVYNWNPRTKAQTTILKLREEDYAFSLQWPRNDTIVTGSTKGHIRLWQVS